MPAPRSLGAKTMICALGLPFSHLKWHARPRLDTKSATTCTTPFTLEPHRGRAFAPFRPCWSSIFLRRSAKLLFKAEGAMLMRATRPRLPILHQRL